MSHDLQLFALRHFEGSDCVDVAKELGQMRRQYFREFPYLYAADAAEEDEYQAAAFRDSEALLVTASVGGKIIGFISGRPLKADLEIIDALPDPSFAVADKYYAGEMIIAPEYRQHGLARYFFSEVEAYAATKGYGTCCFLAVVRPREHPLRPANYRDPEPLFHHFGYAPSPQIVNLSWTTVDAAGGLRRAEHPLRFWLKPII